MSEPTGSSKVQPSDPDGALSAAEFAGLSQEFAADPHNRLMQNALSKQSITEVALDRSIVTSIDHTVSNQVTDRKVTNQKKSGRCWLFAGLNLLRTGVAGRLGVKDFELSQNHLLYWDKLEKANYFLENIIQTADRDIDDRTVAHVLDTPTEDGGQWNMFVALVLKHGLVPQSVMPETEASSNTHAMNDALARQLRKAARDLRAVVAEGGDAEVLRKTKRSALADAHRLLTMHLGTPPESFFWQWTDDDKAFHRDGDLTPQAFAERYLTVDPSDYVCLVNDPRPTSAYGSTYTVDRLGNVVGGPPVTYLNVEIDQLRRLAMDAIVGGEPVWFGCDTGKMSNSELGIWDAALYDYDGVYGTDSAMSKADRLLLHDSLMTHAMLFVGVDVVDGAPRKWRVENSWGDEKGDKGLFTMNDSWFGEYVLEIAVHRDALTPELQAALESEPAVLPAWDPMGALA
ncbi:aminopeptidase C [Leekyejoonella antrihumi]|uniref:Aminopeptidase n=1 Tax=Leekyejoonella antrihumi TaxID=1660198 RepID=A0A563E1Q4_9MICO|nr:C1 family peptidase [Leekyejoonella antrihumi]TWP35834.1 C1 family peptidase [Leekyejoonella antrihumi]